jgi:hypothetical protein
MGQAQLLLDCDMVVAGKKGVLQRCYVKGGHVPFGGGGGGRVVRCTDEEAAVVMLGLRCHWRLR